MTEALLFLCFSGPGTPAACRRPFPDRSLREFTSGNTAFSPSVCSPAPSWVKAPLPSLKTNTQSAITKEAATRGCGLRSLPSGALKTPSDGHREHGAAVLRPPVPRAPRSPSWPQCGAQDAPEARDRRPSASCPWPQAANLNLAGRMTRRTSAAPGGLGLCRLSPGAPSSGTGFQAVSAVPFGVPRQQKS